VKKFLLKETALFFILVNLVFLVSCEKEADLEKTYYVSHKDVPDKLKDFIYANIGYIGHIVITYKDEDKKYSFYKDDNENNYYFYDNVIENGSLIKKNFGTFRVEKGMMYINFYDEESKEPYKLYKISEKDTKKLLEKLRNRRRYENAGKK